MKLRKIMAGILAGAMAVSTMALAASSEEIRNFDMKIGDFFGSVTLTGKVDAHETPMLLGGFVAVKQTSATELISILNTQLNSWNGLNQWNTDYSVKNVKVKINGGDALTPAQLADKNKNWDFEKAELAKARVEAHWNTPDFPNDATNVFVVGSGTSGDARIRPGKLGTITIQISFDLTYQGEDVVIPNSWLKNNEERKRDIGEYDFPVFIYSGPVPEVETDTGTGTYVLISDPTATPINQAAYDALAATNDGRSIKSNWKISQGTDTAATGFTAGTDYYLATATTAPTNAADWLSAADYAALPTAGYQNQYKQIMEMAPGTKPDHWVNDPNSGILTGATFGDISTHYYDYVNTNRAFTLAEMEKFRKAAELGMNVKVSGSIITPWRGADFTGGWYDQRDYDQSRGLGDWEWNFNIDKYSGQYYVLGIGKNLGADKYFNPVFVSNEAATVEFIVPASVFFENNVDWNARGVGIFTDDGYGAVKNIRFEIIDGSGNTFEKGDMNGDGEITPKDALIALQLANSGKATKEEIAKGDMNNDDKITAKDALMILKLANA